MKKLIVLLTTITIFLSGCSSVPLTGRKQLILVSDSEVLTASLQQYSEYISTAKLSTNAKNTQTVVRVGQKIAMATEQYLRNVGMTDEISNFRWEFKLVQDPNINAFCMPGGKIVVYEGLMKLVSNDDELAAVMGHEVAHAVAKHSNERMSQQLVTSYGGAILSAALSEKSAAVQNIASTVYGLGSQVGVTLPFSRKHESEADYMGLVFMAMAGYNMDYAVTFWQKMSAAGGGGTPEFLSTHPSDARRIQDIQKEIPEIRKAMGQ